MKMKNNILAWLGAFALVAAFAISAQAQSYTIDWYKIAGGGGTSTGGT